MDTGQIGRSEPSVIRVRSDSHEEQEQDSYLLH